MKIIYDFENDKHHQIIEDYYFVKYFIKCMNSEWKNFYETSNDLMKAINIIINHQNKILMEKFILICFFLFDGYYPNIKKDTRYNRKLIYIIIFCLNFDKEDKKKLKNRVKYLIESDNYDEYFLYTKNK
jgi:hypothetical protein